MNIHSGGFACTRWGRLLVRELTAYKKNIIEPAPNAMASALAARVNLRNIRELRNIMESEHYQQKH